MFSSTSSTVQALVSDTLPPCQPIKLMSRCPHSGAHALHCARVFFAYSMFMLCCVWMPGCPCVLVSLRAMSGPVFLHTCFFAYVMFTPCCCACLAQWAQWALVVPVPQCTGAEILLIACTVMCCVEVCR